jgi:hypothetical protein
VQTSAAEAPGLESNVDRTCLGIDLCLSFFPCRTTGLICQRMKLSIIVRSQDRRRGGAMSVSEAIPGIVDEGRGAHGVHRRHPG